MQLAEMAIWIVVKNGVTNGTRGYVAKKVSDRK
jgi:hypothetical protein